MTDSEVIEYLKKLIARAVDEVKRSKIVEKEEG